MGIFNHPVHSYLRRVKSRATGLSRKLPLLFFLRRFDSHPRGFLSSEKLGVLIQKAPWCLFIKEEINGLEMSPSTWIQSVRAEACYQEVTLALMKGDEASRRLPTERSRAGPVASESFPLWVEFLERFWEPEARRWTTVSPTPLWTWS